MQCHVCGTEVRPEHKFCMECGARLRRPPGELALAPPPADDEEPRRLPALAAPASHPMFDPATGLTTGQVSSLSDKLNNALASINAGQNKQAINQLNAFISSIQTAVKTGKMSSGTGAALIAAANAIIALL